MKPTLRGGFFFAWAQLIQLARATSKGFMSYLKDQKKARAFLRNLKDKKWVLHMEASKGSPIHVVDYLARYTHRIAISDERGEAYDGQTVRFT
ncbi:MAG: transposase [Planctomycetes bacterium]|nr:transposase [Planctomycetota bacterium]